MKTDVVRFSSDKVEVILEQAEKFAVYKELSRVCTLHLRLLAEEVAGMVRAIAGNVNGEFWMEDKDGFCEMHLSVNSLMDEKKREQLLNAATSGKNEATRGLMGKIRSFFEPSGSVPVFRAGFSGGAPQMYGSYVWSMEDYKDQLRQYREQNKADAQEAWDELEQSVIGNVADNVKVSILGTKVDMVITMELS